MKDLKQLNEEIKALRVQIKKDRRNRNLLIAGVLIVWVASVLFLINMACGSL